MSTTAIYGEKFISDFIHKGIVVEIVKCPETIWCGAVGYAQDNEGEPDIPGLLDRYQRICGIDKNEVAMPKWSCCISIDYWKDGAAKRGIMFAQQVLSAEQDEAYDVFGMPESLYARVWVTQEAAMAAFSRENCEVYELFGVIRAALADNGYVISDSGAQEIEMYDHDDGLFYAYVPVMKV